MGRTELNFLKLVAILSERIGKPTHTMVVLATLESLGIREEDTHKEYGYRNLYDLAVSLFDDLQLNSGNQPSHFAKEMSGTMNSDNLIPVSDYMWVRVGLFLKNYPQGLFHLMPILLQIVAIVFFGYSLWAYLSFNIIQSTAVVLGVIFGLVISGGFIQVIGRQASFYWHNLELDKCREVIKKMIRACFLGLLLSSVGLVVINFLFNLYPLSFVAVTVVYAILIGMLLVVCAPFHTIEKRWIITVIISLATLLALFLNQSTDLHTYLTHWVGITFGIILGLGSLRLYFGKETRYTSWDSKVNSLMITAKNYRLFAYGILIYVFIFIDRFLAWTADIGITHDYLLLYEKQYEIGMDLAIVVFFLLAGVMEYAIASFSKFLNQGQEHLTFRGIESYNLKFKGVYYEHLSWLFLTLLGAVWVLYLLIDSSWGYSAVFGESLPSLSLEVCIISGAGYFFLAWGMMNALYMFSLSQYAKPLKSLVYAILINFSAGLILSRFISFEYSAIGMMFGAMYFAMATTRQCLTFFKNLDYHYYAAY